MVEERAMKTTLTRMHRDERGMSLVFVGVGFMAFLAATTLAIDVGMFATARSQAQNSADSGALAGAVALYFDDYNNRSASGPAVQSALSAARSNDVIHRQVKVEPGDVTFPLSPDGLNNRVRVHVYRTNGRGNALPTLMGRFFGVNTVNIDAVATAEASPANAMTCVKPFTIPDRWIEKQDPGGFNSMTSTFDMYDNHGNPLAKQDIYIDAYHDGYTGYNAERDKGMELMIRAGTGSDIMPSFYFSYAMGGLTGGDDYRWNIANCNTTIMGYGDLLLMEPGNMVGPTIDGIDDLIAQDQSAYWDTGLNCAVTGKHPSPRIVAIPLYDPVYYDTGKLNGRTADLKVAQYMGFFIERREGNDVYGRITPISGLIKGSGAGAAPPGAFPKAIRLVE
jgi:putative Flp pilus-assembly TadE/G-like protein